MYRKKQSCLAKVWQHFWIVVMALLSLCMTLGKAQAKEALCAEVKIVIEQKLSFERQAFDAKMIIHNGLEDMVVEDVNIDLLFMDAQRQPVMATSDPNAENARFFYRIDSLDGIAATDGHGRVETKTSAEIHWMIIPTAGAAERSSTMYYVGAKVSYTLNGQLTELEVTPEYIVVKPLPKLAVDYFLPAEVYGDDPFTEEVEPQEPFTFGVRITNSGFGDAPNTMIESAQPKIVENKQNLLSGFEILGGYVSDIPAGKSLLLNFDNIAAGKAKVGRWSMVSTLSGKFVEFNANFTHADELGGAVTSLLERVTTHTLIHDVKVDLDGRDAIRDFLALDGDVLRVYESDGIDTEVADRSADARLINSNGLTTVSFPPYAGFVYVKLDDPYQGKALPIKALRSDGKVLPEENIWLSKTFNDDLTWSYYVNIFDADSTGQYAFEWTQTPKTAISGKVYQDINGNGVQDPGENGIGVVDIMLNGLDDSGMQISLVAYTNSNGLFAFNDLNAGIYALEVGPVEGMTNGLAVAGDAGGYANNGSVNGIRLTSGIESQGYLFAKQPASVVIPQGPSISGTVYLDSNNNGLFDPIESGIADAVVMLAGKSQNGETVNREVTTNSAGEFTFKDLPVGRYLIAAKAIGGMVDGPATIGNAGGMALVGVISAIVVDENTHAQGYLLAKQLSGVVIPQTPSISGTVYLDSNNNGLFDPTESGIADAVVMLSGKSQNGETVNREVKANSAGEFTFKDLPVGRYSIGVKAIGGMVDRLATAGDSGGIATIGVVNAIAVDENTKAQGYWLAKKLVDNAVDPQSGSIGGKVEFSDMPNTLPGTPKAKLTLFGSVQADEPSERRIMLTTYIDESGTFVFDNLTAGIYTMVLASLEGGDVAEQYYLPPFYPAMFPGMVHDINLTEGEIRSDYYFRISPSYMSEDDLLLMSGSLSGKVFIDKSGNGIYDEGQPGIANMIVGVTMFNDGDPADIMITNGSGEFAFNKLIALPDWFPWEGIMYRLWIQDPYSSFPGDLQQRLWDHQQQEPYSPFAGKMILGSADSEMGKNSIGFKLTEGEAAYGYGFARKAELDGASLSGMVYLDTNNNGMMDGNEFGLGGIKVNLSGPTSVSTVTDLSGYFEFSQLKQGKYTLSVDDAAKLLNGQATAGSASGTVLAQGQIKAINLADGANATGYLLAKTSFAEGSFISGIVYEENNDRQIVNNGEAGIAGVTVSVTGTNDHGVIVNKTSITDMNGQFVISGLDFGLYDLSVGSVNRMSDSAASIGNAGGQYSIMGGKVSQIKLTREKVNGEGYRFAKRSENSTIPYADLALSASVSTVEDNMLTVNWTVKNNGPATAFDTQVYLVLPPFVGTTWFKEEHNIVRSFGDLAPQESKTLSITFIAELGNDITLNGFVASQRPDPVVSNSTSTLVWQGSKQRQQ